MTNKDDDIGIRFHRVTGHSDRGGRISRGNCVRRKNARLHYLSASRRSYESAGVRRLRRPKLPSCHGITLADFALPTRPAP